ncbi:MAG TPA: hypothetical protein VLL98_04525 [Rickettsiales bacterium]|nr:hypothetical protein [Rickettsiales bacterium]
MIDYVNTTLDYLKNTLDGIKNGLISIKDIAVAIGNVISTIVDILGFIGFRVFILLITTCFIVWLLNLVSPISRKTNYFIAVGLVLWIGITANMPTQTVMLKYILIIFSPFIITSIVNFLIRNFNKYTKFITNKILLVFSKLKFKGKIFKIEKGNKIGILFDRDLPTLDEIETINNKLKEASYEPIIVCDEKISLTDNDGKIVFSNGSMFRQFINSIKDKNIKLLWFWGSSYKDNKLIDNLLDKSKKIKQTKLVISSNNNQILNFLQSKWDWKVIYGQNLKNYDNFIDINDILSEKWFNLYLINDFEVKDGYFLKEKIVGGDLHDIVHSIGTNSQLNFKDKILFFDCIFNSKEDFYKHIMHLKNFILYKKHFPKAIILGKIIIENNLNYTDIIKEFDISFKERSLNIPIFQSTNIDFIILNTYHIINYNMGKINLI